MAGRVADRPVPLPVAICAYALRQSVVLALQATLLLALLAGVLAVAAAVNS